MFTETPRFTIRVWGSPGECHDHLMDMLGQPRSREPYADIEVDTTDNEPWELTVASHRGCEVIPQKMLGAAPEQPTLWHQSD